MQASVIYTLLHDNTFILKVFIWDGADLKFEIGRKGEIYITLNLSANFSINTTYKQPIFLVFGPLS